jgi:hypothetical protein
LRIPSPYQQRSPGLISSCTSARPSSPSCSRATTRNSTTSKHPTPPRLSTAHLVPQARLTQPPRPWRPLDALSRTAAPLCSWLLSSLRHSCKGASQCPSRSALCRATVDVRGRVERPLLSHLTCILARRSIKSLVPLPFDLHERTLQPALALKDKVSYMPSSVLYAISVRYSHLNCAYGRDA